MIKSKKEIREAIIWMAIVVTVAIFIVFVIDNMSHMTDECRQYCHSINSTYGGYESITKKCVCRREVVCYLDYPEYCPIGEKK